jgi:hypothetical protein
MKRGVSIQFRYVHTCRLADRGRQSDDVYLFYTVRLTFNYGRYARGQLATAIYVLPIQTKYYLFLPSKQKSKSKSLSSYVTIEYL